MAKRKRPARRATDHADFAGRKANKAEVKRLSAAGATNRRSRKKKAVGNGDMPLPLEGGGNVGEPSEECVIRNFKDVRAAIARRDKARQHARDLSRIVTNYFKSAGTDGMDVRAMKRMLEDAKRPVGVVVAERRATQRYEQIDGSPLGGAQWNLFDEDGKSAAIDAYAMGEHAGLNGEPRDNIVTQFAPGSENHERALAGWASGQAKLARETMGQSSEAPSVA
jgi:hypothetical protein